MKFKAIASACLLFSTAPVWVHADCLQSYQNEISRLQKIKDSDNSRMAQLEKTRRHPVKRALVAAGATIGTGAGAGAAIAGPGGALLGGGVALLAFSWEAFGSEYDVSRDFNSHMINDVEEANSTDSTVAQLNDLQIAFGLLKDASTGTVAGDSFEKATKANPETWDKIRETGMSDSDFLQVLKSGNTLRAFCSGKFASTTDLLKSALNVAYQENGVVDSKKQAFCDRVIADDKVVGDVGIAEDGRSFHYTNPVSNQAD